jgi:GNAT superfamily N-acetyltransferase
LRVRFAKLKLTHIEYLSRLNFKDKHTKKDTEKLQWFINNRALKHQERQLGITYVILHENSHIGYITVSTSNIPKHKISESKRPVSTGGSILPAIIIQYFAIHLEHREKGFGSEVLEWTYGLGKTIARKIGCRYIILYTKSAKNFYEKNGFSVSEIEEEDESFYFMYRDLFPKCVNLDK